MIIGNAKTYFSKTEPQRKPWNAELLTRNSELGTRNAEGVSLEVGSWTFDSMLDLTKLEVGSSEVPSVSLAPVFGGEGEGEGENDLK